MREADVFVLPSLWENLPYVQIEAMASGLPIVSTTAGGIPGTVDADSGILVPPGDAAVLTRAGPDVGSPSPRPFPNDRDCGFRECLPIPSAGWKVVGECHEA